MQVDRRQPSDALTAHRHDHLATAGNVSHVPAQMVVQLADPNLILEQIMWRHTHQYKHHNRHRKAINSRLASERSENRAKHMRKHERRSRPRRDPKTRSSPKAERSGVRTDTRSGYNQAPLVTQIGCSPERTLLTLDGQIRGTADRLVNGCSE